MPAFFSSTCQNASFSWAAKWLIDGVWGYKADNGTVIQEWKQEFTKLIPARWFVPTKIPCKGALDIITIWQDQSEFTYLCFICSEIFNMYVECTFLLHHNLYRMVEHVHRTCAALPF